MMTVATLGPTIVGAPLHGSGRLAANCRHQTTIVALSAYSTGRRWRKRVRGQVWEMPAHRRRHKRGLWLRRASKGAMDAFPTVPHLIKVAEGVGRTLLLMV